MDTHHVGLQRVAMVSLLMSACLAVAILLTVASVRTHDLEKIHERDSRQLKELAILHEAICDMRSGYRERQVLFGMFLSRPFPGGPTKQLIIALKGSFAETLFALREITCVPPLGTSG